MSVNGRYVATVNGVPIDIMARHVYDPDLDGIIALAQLVAAVCSDTDTDGKITTHAGVAAAHHAVHLKTLADHVLGTVVPHDALASLTEKAHSSLTGIGTSDHHAKTIDASELTAGILALARLSGITNTQIAAAAAIAESKLSLDQGTQALFDKIVADIATHAGIAAAHHAKTVIADLSPIALADLDTAVCSETEVVPIVEAAGLALATGKNIKVTSILTANDTWSGLSAILTAGEVLALGEAVYLKAADSEVYKALATATTTMPSIALATCATTDGNAFEFLLRGFMRHDAWDWTPGGLLYIDRTTAGALTQTAPSTTGDQVQVVGVAITADIIFFCSSLVLAEVA